MILNGKKLFHVRFSRTCMKHDSTYKLNSELLLVVNEVRDLDVIMSKKLHQNKFNSHLDAIVKR